MDCVNLNHTTKITIRCRNSFRLDSVTHGCDTEIKLWSPTQLQNIEKCPSCGHPFDQSLLYDLGEVLKKLNNAASVVEVELEQA